MKGRSSSLDAIDRSLRQATKILAATATKIRAAKFAPKRNVFRISHALADIFDIQNEIYRERPDLLPAHLADTDYGRAVLSYQRSKRSRGKRPPSRASERKPSNRRPPGGGAW
jgi:hypothetical protein